MSPFTPRAIGLLTAQAKKRSTRVVLALLTLVIVGVSITAEPKPIAAFSSGSGTIADPYVISNCAELQSINDDPSYLHASYELAGNIDCSGISPFTPIGIYNASFGNYFPFMGRFDGQGFTISNVTVGSASAQYQGLFNNLSGAAIKNLNLDNFVIDSLAFGGTLAGIATNSSIKGVAVTNSTVTVHGNFGVYGGAIAGRFDKSYAYGLSATTTTVTAVGTGGGSTSRIGGLLGDMFNSVLEQSSAGVLVSTDATSVGGIVGFLSAATIKDSYSDSIVTGFSNVGGIVGNGGDVYSVYSNASTTATNPAGLIGGIAGSGTIISNSFAFGPVSSTTGSGGISGGSATLSNTVYYPTGTGQTRCSSSGSYTAGQCTSNDTASYYYASTNAPLSSWNFASTWVEVPSALPELQVFPYADPVIPVAVTTCTELATNVRANPNGWFTLSNDIDCAGDSTLLPLNGRTATSSGFVGILDGQGFTISNIAMSKTAAAQDRYGFGLFSKLYGATISNITLTGGGVTALTRNVEYVGALAGHGHGLLVDNVTSTVPVNTGRLWGGGLIGGASGYFDNVVVAADVDYTYGSDYTYYIGGLFGEGEWVYVSNSSYSGNITGYQNVAAIVGVLKGLTVDSVTSSGLITADSYVGGIAGYIMGSANAPSTITNSSSTINFVSNPANDDALTSVGGIVGFARSTDITNSSYVGTITPGAGYYSSNIGGIAGSISGIYTATSTVLNVTSDLNITITGTHTFEPYLQAIGGLIGSVNYVAIANATASTTMRLGNEPTSNYIDSFSRIAGFIASASDFEISNSEASGSIEVYEDYSGASGGYGWGLAGFIGFGQRGVIQSATSSVDVFLKSHSPGDMGGLIGEGDDMFIYDTHVTGDFAVDAAGYVYDIGGFIGYSFNNVIASSSARGDVSVLNTIETYNVGGFLGVTYDSTINKTYTDNSVTVEVGADGTTAGYNYGGFAGNMGGGNTFTDTYASTTLNITSAVLNNPAGTDIGGYVGYVDLGTNIITNAYSSGSLSLIADSTAPFQRVGGFAGASIGNATFTNLFTVTSIPGIASSTNVGGFIGAYDGGETFTANAYDATRTGQTLCTGIDGVDPGWCTIRNVGGAEPNYFYSSANAPQSAWDFSSVWLVRTLDYPIFGAGSPPASTPATVGSTAGATSITQTSATVAGNITNLGSGTVTTRGFVHGSTPLFGATTTEASAGFTTGVFNTGLSSLVCNTTYYFAAYASGSEGLSYGSTESFTTSACGGGGTPPSVATNATTPTVTKTTVNLSGTISSLGTAAVTARGFVYGLTGSFGATSTENSTGFSTGAFTGTVSDLTCSTAYSYAAYALSADGLNYGATRTFSTEACSSGSTGTRVKKNDPVTLTPVPATPVPAPTPALVPVTPVPAPTSAPIPAPTPDEPTPVATCEETKSARVFATLDTISYVTVTAPAAAVTSPAKKTTTESEYSLYLQVTPINGKGVQKQIDNFIELLDAIAAKREESDELPYGLVKKVGSVTYVPPTIGNIVAASIQESVSVTENTQASANVAELKVSSNPCNQSVTPTPIPTPTPTPSPEPVTPELDPIPVDGQTEEKQEPEILESIVGETILDVDFSTLEEKPIELLVTPFEVVVRDEFGDIIGTFDKPLELTIYNPDVAGVVDQLYITALSDDGVTWFEVPFRVEGDSIIFEIKAPGQYFIWLLPKKALAAEELLPETTPQPFAFSLPLWLVNLLSALGLSSGLALATILLSQLPFSLTHLRRITTTAAHNLFGLITFKKKRQPWGTVYDSVTKAPVDPAYVELFDTEGNKQAEAITDLDGRYGFLVPEGSYVMNVRKTNYLFPSKIQKLGKQDIIYSNLYQGGTFTTSSTVAHDIPMDPEVFDWNQAEKLRTKQTKFFSKLDPVIVQLLDLFFFLGVIAVIVQAIATTNTYTIVIAVLYLVLLAARLYGGKPMLYGTVTKNGDPLQFALIRVYREGREVASKVTDAYGRYVAILEPGTYEVTVEERIDEENYRSILKRTVKTKNGTLNRRLVVG